MIIYTLTCYTISFIFLDEKEKQDPIAFRDAIIVGLNGTQNDLEQVMSARALTIKPKMT